MYPKNSYALDCTIEYGKIPSINGNGILVMISNYSYELDYSIEYSSPSLLVMIMIAIVMVMVMVIAMIINMLYSLYSTIRNSKNSS